MMIPAVDFPPDSFGTREEPKSQVLIDAVEEGPQCATIVMAYVMRVSSEPLRLSSLPDMDRKVTRVEGSIYD